MLLFRDVTVRDIYFCFGTCLGWFVSVLSVLGMAGDGLGAHPVDGWGAHPGDGLGAGCPRMGSPAHPGDGLGAHPEWLEKIGEIRGKIR